MCWKIFGLTRLANATGDSPSLGDVGLLNHRREHRPALLTHKRLRIEGIRKRDRARKHKHTKDSSEQWNRRSCIMKEAPCESSESRSISPNRIPPLLLRPYPTQYYQQQNKRMFSFRIGGSSEFAYLDWLVGETVNRTRRAHLGLVKDHVTQSLVVHNAREDVCLQLSAMVATAEKETRDNMRVSHSWHCVVSTVHL